MNERTLQIRVGIVVIAAVAVVVCLVGLFGLGFRQQYTLEAVFPTAPGVAPDTPIRKNGVLIGRVEKVELIDPEGVRVTMKIDSNRPLRKSEVPVIGTASLFGDAVVEFVPKDEGVFVPDVYEDGSTIPVGLVQRNPLEALDMAVRLEDDIRQALKSVEEAGQSVQTIAERVQAVQVDDTIKELNTTMRKVGDAAEGINTTATKFQAVADDAQTTVGEVKAAASEFRTTAAGIRDMTDEAKKLSADIQTTSAEIRGAARQINEVFAENRTQIERILAKSELAVDDIRTTLQSIGNILSDEEILAGLRAAAGELPLVLEEARKTLQTAQGTLTQFETVAATAQRNLTNLEGLTKPLGEAGPDLVKRLQMTLARLEIAVDEASTFGRSLNSKDSNLGRLLNDPNLVGSVERTVMNVEEASRRLRPILEDVRIFTDKIARDPRQLGSRARSTAVRPAKAANTASRIPSIVKRISFVV